MRWLGRPPCRRSDPPKRRPPTAPCSARPPTGSVNINDYLDDPLQLDMLFWGFAGSHVLGTPEGLAAYQNEAFGDGLNWDLFPDVALTLAASKIAAPPHHPCPLQSQARGGVS
jgi:hypothetical protein